MGSRRVKYDRKHIVQGEWKQESYIQQQEFTKWGQWWSIQKFLRKKNMMLSELYFSAKSQEKENTQKSEKEGRENYLYLQITWNFYIIIPKESIKTNRLHELINATTYICIYMYICVYTYISYHQNWKIIFLQYQQKM